MTAPIAGMGCANCAFFERTNEGYGECRRHAPQPNACVFVTKNDTIGKVKTDIHWPKVYDSNWCGQFSVRKKAQSKTVAKPVVIHKPISESKADGDVLKLKDEEPVKRPPPEITMT